MNSEITENIDPNDLMNEILSSREDIYGDFTIVGITSQMLKSTLRLGKSWNTLTPEQRESLELTCNKLSRIVNGDPNYPDSWLDISGYARLIYNKLIGGKGRIIKSI
jgi:hypothetical protein